MRDAARLLLDDENARTDALDTSRSFIVQAPAGSGKTELLIQRYLRLLAIVENPEEILAITFTRKAALEMQTRINDALHEARLGKLPELAHRQQTIELAHLVLQRDEQLGWRLAESARRMRIQTLDSFCAGLTKSLPVSSGLGGTLTTLADAEMQSLYKRAAAATLDWLLQNDNKSAAVETMLAHLDNHTGVYIEYLARMIETRDRWLGLVGSGTQQDALVSGATRRHLEHGIRFFISWQLQKLLDVFRIDQRDVLLPLLRYGAEQLVCEGRGDHSLVALAGITRFPECEMGDLPAWRAVANLLLKQDGDWRRSVNKSDGFPAKDSGEKRALQELLGELQEQDLLRVCLQRVRLLPDPAYNDTQWQVLLALLSLLPLAAAELRRLFSERGITDHTEVALAAGAALGEGEEPGEVALRLDYSIQHILIDEMQDTSIGQFALIEKLIAGWIPGDGKTLFCVGDPMQSIYRFRDAEVGRFLQIREHGIGTLRPASLVLRRNFRSGGNLVHWFNTVFDQVLPQKDDVVAGAISYSASVPVEVQGNEGEWQLHTLFGASAGEEADYARDVIRQCIAGGEKQTRALLVRSRAQLPDLLSRLRDAGIEYSAVEIDRLTDLPEIVDLIALTRALSHEADRLGWLALLRGPWVGLTWSDLHRLVYNDASRTVRELLGDCDRLATLSQDGQQRLQRVSQFLHTHCARRQAESFRERAEIAWYGLGGPALLQGRQQLENVYRYFDVLEKLESAGTLIDIAELESRLDDERVTSNVDDPYALQVMTMHKAKGLEFDQVLLYALGRSTRARRRSILSWTNLPYHDNVPEILLSPIGPRAELEGDSLHRCIEATEADKERLELDRLLYVACTRARRSLHLIGSVALNKDRASFRPPPDGTLLGRLWPAVAQHYHDAFARGNCIASGIADEGPRFIEPSLRRFRAPFELPPPPELPGTTVRRPVTDTEIDIDYYWVGMAARHTGTIVHKWLKQIADGVLAVDVSSVESLRPATLRMATELGLAESASRTVCERVEQAISRVLQDPRGRWLLSGDGHAELPISGLWGGQAVSIVIDRIRFDAGTHWIIDYKTSVHEGGDLEGFLKQEVERYRPQLYKYAKLYRRLADAPVRTALYFPLLKEFREVEID